MAFKSVMAGLLVVGIASVVTMSVTAAEVPISIRDLTIETTSASVTVRWKTNVLADSRLFYTTQGRGILHSKYSALLVRSEKTTEHEITLTHLPSGTEIDLYVESRGEGGISGRSTDLRAVTSAYLRSFLVLGPLSPATAGRTEPASLTPALGNHLEAQPWVYHSTLHDRVELPQRVQGNPGDTVLVGVYAFVPKAQYVRILWQGKDEAVLWVNGGKLVSRQARGAGVNRLDGQEVKAVVADGRETGVERVFPAPLASGWNLILAKLVLQENGGSFTCRVLDSNDDVDIVFSKLAFEDVRPKLKLSVTRVEEGPKPYRLEWTLQHPKTDPKWIQTGWGRLYVSDLVDQKRTEELERRYSCFDGIVVGFNERNSRVTPYGGFWPWSGITLSYDKDVAEEVKRYRGVHFSQWKDNFVWVQAYQARTGWLFDDAEWLRMRGNFEVVGRVVKEGGFRGILLDCETPGGAAIWNPETYGKDYPDAEAVSQRAFARGREIVTLLQRLCPDIAVVSVDSSRVLEAGRSSFNFRWGKDDVSSATPGRMPNGYRLFSAFLAGMIAGAEGKTMIVEGEYSNHAGNTINGPARGARLWQEVLPHWTADAEQVLPASQWLRHSSVSGRVNTYEAPGRNLPDAGMEEKLLALHRGANAPYLWVYWQSYLPDYGWDDFWLPEELKAKRAAELKEGKIIRIIPSLIEGLPVEFFAAMERAKRALAPAVVLRAGDWTMTAQTSGSIDLDIKPGQIVEAVGRCDGSEIKSQAVAP